MNVRKHEDRTGRKPSSLQGGRHFPWRKGGAVGVETSKPGPGRRYFGLPDKNTKVCLSS